MQAYLGSFNYLHSVIRYFILFFAIIVVLQSIAGMLQKKKFKKVHKQVALFLLIFCDLQLLIGILLYVYKVIQPGLLSAGYLQAILCGRTFRIYDHCYCAHSRWL
jgi:Na+/H+-dicarboxylate symporter